MAGTQCPKCGRWMTAQPESDIIYGKWVWFGTTYYCERCDESIYVDRPAPAGGERR
jgi:hypothetical protein